MTETAPSPSTTQFKNLIEESLFDKKKLSFVIFESIGPPKSIKEKLANKLLPGLSLSALTFPHQMVRLILIEQIYRVECLIKGHPYHK